MPSDRTKEQALDALEGMRTIVKAEMVQEGVYVTELVVDEKMAASGTLCKGHRYCAVGSLFVAGGARLVPTYVDNAGQHYDLEGTGGDRRDFLRHRHGLRLAMATLNDVARQYAGKHGITLERDYDDPIEDLFESGHFTKSATRRWPGTPPVATPEGRRELLKIIAAAKRRVKAA